MDRLNNPAHDRLPDEGDVVKVGVLLGSCVDAVQKAYELVGMLEDSINPILMPPSPSGVDDHDRTRPGNAPLVMSLMDHYEQIVNLQRRIESINDRVRV